MAVKYIPLTNKEKYETPDWGYKPHILSPTVTLATVTEAPAYDSSFKKAEEIVASAIESIKEQEPSSDETQDKGEDISPEQNNQNSKESSKDKKANFISVLTPIYENALKERGLDSKFAKFLVAQDGLESGWDLKETKGYNIGNITTGSNWSGKSEIRGDKNAKGEKIKQQFRLYNNLSEYVSDKIDLLAGSRYNTFSLAPTIENFVDTLVRGGYASDPQYKSKILNIYRSLQKGGTIQAAKEALNNWNKERLALLQANAEAYADRYIPQALAYNYLRNNINRAKVVQDSTLNVEGKYTPWTHTITLNNPQALLHELAHASHPDMQTATIEKIIKEMDGKIVENGIRLDDYWDHPQEIYARLMEWRYTHNINPKEHLTWEQVEQFKKDILKGIQLTTKTEDQEGNMNFITTEISPDGKVVKASPMQEGHHLVPEEMIYRNVYEEDPLQIDGRYNTEFILRLQNEVAQNRTNKKKDSLLAKLGGKL